MIFSLRGKITLFFVAVILALVVSTFWQVNSRVESSLREILRSQLKENKKVFFELQAFSLNQIQGKSSLAARQNRVEGVMMAVREMAREGAPREEQVRNVNAVVQAVASDLKVEHFMVYDSQGLLMFPKALSKEPSLAKLPAVEQALRTQQGQQQVMQFKGALYLAAATPILYRDDTSSSVLLLGAVLVAEPLNPLARNVQQIAGGQTQVTILSSSGKILESTMTGTNRQALDQALAARKDHFELVQHGTRQQALLTLPLAGDRYVALVIPIYQGLDKTKPAAERKVAGTLTLIRSLDQILARQMAQIQKRMLLIGLVAIVLTVLLNIAFARSLTRPLHRLTEGVGEVAKGNLKLEVPVTSRDEIGLLTARFNEMVVGLSQKEKLRRMVSDAAARQVETGASLQLGGVKEHVTVFFSDIRNFTPMTEALGAAEIIELLNRYFAVAGQVIADHGGDIDKFIGDAIMVVFRNDDESSGAVKAVTCAVEMQRQVATFNELSIAQGRPPISIGVGIATGDVVAGNVGTPQRLEYTVLGDTVNVAARLETESKVGKHLQVMLDPETYARVEDLAEVAVLDGVQLKGKSGPMTVYEVKGLK